MTEELRNAILELLRVTDHAAQQEGGWQTSTTALQNIGRFIEERLVQEPLHAFVTVSGGVAYMVQEPAKVRVHLIDYDDLQADFTRTFDQLSAEAQAFYSENERRISESEFY